MQRHRPRRTRVPNYESRVVGQSDMYDDGADDGDAVEDFGRRLLGGLGVLTTQPGREDGMGGVDPDLYYEQVAPDDTWEGQSGHERRRLLSDWVSKDDPRRFGDEDEQSFDPDEGYLLDLGDDDGGGGGGGIKHRQKGGFVDAQNLDGLIDLDGMGDPEMQEALAYTSRGMVPRTAARGLCRRFDKAQKRAMRHESKTFDDRTVFLQTLRVATTLKAGHARNARIASLFSPSVRIRDLERAIVFFRENTDAMSELDHAIKTAPHSERQHYADFLQDLWDRIHTSTDRIQSHRDSSASSSSPTPRIGDRLQPRVGHATNRRRHRRHERDNAVAWRHRPRGAGTVPVLELPVLSRAWWSIGPKRIGGSDNGGDDGGHARDSLSPSGSGVYAQEEENADADNDDAWIWGKPNQTTATANTRSETSGSNKHRPGYFEPGNTLFLGARLGMRTEGAQRRAEADAILFFYRRFGLNFGPKSGAKRDQSTGRISHAKLPLILEPYTVSARLVPRIELAEGHLSSATHPPGGTADPLGNGLRRYLRDGESEQTSVAEAGWLVRNTSNKPVPIPNSNNNNSTGVQWMLPKGGILATGFWLLERPDAPPALLRFQSSRPPLVRKRALTAPNTRTKQTIGVCHEILSQWDVYDMAHNAAHRPTMAIGKAATLLRIKYYSRKRPQATRYRNSHESHTVLSMIH